MAYFASWQGAFPKDPHPPINACEYISILIYSESIMTCWSRHLHCEDERFDSQQSNRTKRNTLKKQDEIQLTKQLASTLRVLSSSNRPTSRVGSLFEINNQLSARSSSVFESVKRKSKNKHWSNCFLLFIYWYQPRTRFKGTRRWRTSNN